MWPCWSRVVAGASNRSERQSAETPERRRAGRGQSCTPREAAPRPSAPAVRRARGAGLHALPHPAESPLCVVSRRLSHCRPHPPLLPDRAHRRAPAGRGGARRPANERAPGTTPRGTPVWVSARARAARGPHASWSSRPGRTRSAVATNPRTPRATESELTCFEFQVINYVLNGPARHTQRVT